MNLSLILPEIILFVGAISILMADVFFAKRFKEFFYVTHLISLLVCAVALSMIFKEFKAPEIIFNGMFESNFFTAFVKAMICVLLTIVILFSLNFLYSIQKFSAEFLALMLIAAVGGMILISANNFLVFYLALELQSLSLYLLAALNKKSSNSSEAGMKYFILGSVASGILLFGISMIYGFAGTINFGELSQLYKDGQDSIPIAVMFGFIMVITAMFFKIAAAPFHMWSPDVYEGCATIVTTFFATVAKFAAVLALIRIFMVVLIEWEGVDNILIAVSMASLAVGSFGAICQKNLKRLFAYSSIGHMGFVLLALATLKKEGFEAAVLYMVVYSLLALGTFGFFNLMCSTDEKKDGTDAENAKVFDISSLAGFSKTNPLMAFSLAVIMFSTAGIPPLAGFFTKFHVIISAFIGSHFYAAIAALLFSVVSAFYYLRIVKVMYFDEPKAKPSMVIEDISNIKTVIFCIAIVNLVFIVFLNQILDLINNCL